MGIDGRQHRGPEKPMALGRVSLNSTGRECVPFRLPSRRPADCLRNRRCGASLGVCVAFRIVALWH